MIRCILARVDRLVAVTMGGLLVASSIWFFAIDSGFGYRGPRVDADGIYFFHYLRSLVMDGDVDFRNDYNKYGNPWRYEPTAKGLPMNPATVGTAILWAPFYLPARGAVELAARAGVAVRTDGTSHAEELAAFYGTLLYGFFALVLALRLCRRLFPRGPALLGAVAAAIGGNLIFYMVVQPSYSHAPAAFAFAAFVERWEATRERRSVRGWALLGALGGLAMLIRPQLAVLALLPLADVAQTGIALARGRRCSEPVDRERLRQVLSGGLVGAGAALLVFSPQMIIWQIIHGHPVVVPQGRTFMQWGDSLWSEVLFHPRAGLLPWMPLAFPALLGLGWMAIRRRAIGLPLVLVFAAMVYVNGATWDWWAGYSYGARRFTETYVLLALGLTATLALAWDWAKRRAAQVAVGSVVAVVGAFCLLNMAMLLNRRQNRVDWYSNKEFYKVYVDAVRVTAEDVHDTVGNPFSWPANLLFAARHGVSPGSYDEVAASYLLDDKHPITHSGWPKKLRDVLDLTSDKLEPFLDGGFGHVQNVQKRRARLVVEREACVMIPLIQRPDINVILHGGAFRPTNLRLTVNGEPVGSMRRLDEPWQAVEVAVPANALSRGVNELCLQHEPLADADAAAGGLVGTTGVRAPVDIAVYSAGSYAGNRAEVWVAGAKVGTNQRGINAVAIHPRTGEVLSATGFDVCYWHNGGRLLEKWVAGFPPGTIVAMAVRWSAARLFDNAARSALARIGSTENLRKHARHSFAVIGVTGAPPGSARQALAPKKPAVVVVGRKPASWTGLAHYDRLTLVVTRDMDLR